MFYAWQSEKDFENWHSVVKQYLRIPHPNKNSKSGEMDEKATWTTEYTTLKTDDNGVMFAKVEEEIATQFSEGLGEPHEPYFDTSLVE